MAKIMYSDNGSMHRILATLIDVNYSTDGTFCFKFKANDFEHIHVYEIESTLKDIEVEHTLVKILEFAWARIDAGYNRISNTFTISTFEKLVGHIENAYNEGKFE